MTQLSQSFKNQITDEDISVSVISPRGEKMLSHSASGVKSSLEKASEISEEMDKLEKKYGELLFAVDGINRKHQQGQIDRLERNWLIGKEVVQERESYDGEDHYPQNSIVASVLGCSGDSISDYTIMYRAFPDKGFNPNHKQTTVREFAVESISTDRGVRGYHRYDENGYEWPTSVRRSWCTTEESKYTPEETIEQYISYLSDKMPKRKQQELGLDGIATYLQEMVDVSDMDRSLTHQKAKLKIQDFINS